MPSEMVSGPDLGAGFLHQLSREVEGNRTTFTYHAQDGGSDAAGPPKGPLTVFGFVHPPLPCMFGGPRCWHRRFLLPFGETAKVRLAYNRNRFVLSTMIDQVYARVPATVDSGLGEVVRRLTPALESEGIEWHVGGTTAAWLQGASVSPRDLDLGTTRDGVDRIAALLAEFLIEPLGPTDWPGAGIVQAARAFVGTFREGIRVEWAVPLEPRAPRPFEERSGRPGVARLEWVTFHDTKVRVSRPEYALLRAAEKRDGPELTALVALVRRRGPDRDLLDVLLGRSPLAEGERRSLRQALGA